MDYKLNVVRIHVTDWARAFAFYAETLGMPVHFADAEMGWAEFETGEARLAIERADPNDPEAAELIGRFASVSLQVSDIETTVETLRARGVAFVGEPERQSWGGVLAHLADPDGNVLTLLGS